MERGDGDWCGRGDRIGFVLAEACNGEAALGKGEGRTPMGQDELVEETRLHDSLAGCAKVRRILKLPCRKSTLICAAYDTQRMAGVRCIG